METTLAKIKALVAEYYAEQFGAMKFVPGETLIQHSGKVFDEREMQSMVEAVLDGWWTNGRFVEQFEKQIAAFVGVRYAVLVNSGSSANLLAFAALTSPTMGERRIREGDEVLTVAAGFPTTVNPIFQMGAVPVFVDADLTTLGVDVKLFERAISPKTRAIMIAHPLGNMLDMDSLQALCRQHNLWLVEDACDALGSTYRGKQAGSFGDAATVSFFPAHHITMGEGGVVLTNNEQIYKAVLSFRDWGRDLDAVPQGYDRSYTYSHPGYNLKTTDLQAACGVVQLEKLAGFTRQRQQNYAALRERLARFGQYFQFIDATPNSEPSWFGFALVLREDCPFTRDEIVQWLGERKIVSRRLFAGNLLRQPYFADYRIPHRVAGELTNTNIIHERLFWIGCYQGIGEAELDYIERSFAEVIEERVVGAASRVASQAAP